MPKPMTLFGVGPRWGLISLAYAVFAYLVTRVYPVLKFPGEFYPVLNFLGIILLLIGLPYYLLAGKTIVKGFAAGQLVTTGVYGICRHPLYGSWIVFLAPGIVLLAHSWFALTVPVVMYIVLRLMVRKEEDYLAATFGERYLHYKATVPFVCPIGWLKKQAQTTGPDSGS